MQDTTTAFLVGQNAQLQKELSTTTSLNHANTHKIVHLINTINSQTDLIEYTLNSIETYNATQIPSSNDVLLETLRKTEERVVVLEAEKKTLLKNRESLVAEKIKFGEELKAELKGEKNKKSELEFEVSQLREQSKSFKEVCRELELAAVELQKNRKFITRLNEESKFLKNELQKSTEISKAKTNQIETLKLDFSSNFQSLKVDFSTKFEMLKRDFKVKSDVFDFKLKENLSEIDKLTLETSSLKEKLSLAETKLRIEKLKKEGDNFDNSFRGENVLDQSILGGMSNDIRSSSFKEKRNVSFSEKSKLNKTHNDVKNGELKEAQQFGEDTLLFLKDEKSFSNHLYDKIHTHVSDLENIFNNLK